METIQAILLSMSSWAPAAGATAVYLGVMIAMILMAAGIGYILFTFGKCLVGRISGKTNSFAKCAFGPGCPC